MSEEQINHRVKQIIFDTATLVILRKFCVLNGEHKNAEVIDKTMLKLRSEYDELSELRRASRLRPMGNCDD